METEDGTFCYDKTGRAGTAGPTGQGLLRLPQLPQQPPQELPPAEGKGTSGVTVKPR